MKYFGVINGPLVDLVHLIEVRRSCISSHDIPFHEINQAYKCKYWKGDRYGFRTLIELEYLNSSFSGSSFSIRAFRPYPLIEIIQTAPRRAIPGKLSDSRQQYLSHQYPPPHLISCLTLAFVESNRNIQIWMKT